MCQMAEKGKRERKIKKGEPEQRDDVLKVTLQRPGREPGNPRPVCCMVLLEVKASFPLPPPSF